VVLFENTGDTSLNNRITKKLGYLKQYKDALKYINDFPYSYVLVNMSAKLENKILRVSSNLFGERGRFIEFFA